MQHSIAIRQYWEADLWRACHVEDDGDDNQAKAAALPHLRDAPTLSSTPQNEDSDWRGKSFSSTWKWQRNFPIKVVQMRGKRIAIFFFRFSTFLCFCFPLGNWRSFKGKALQETGLNIHSSNTWHISRGSEKGKKRNAILRRVGGYKTPWPACLSERWPNVAEENRPMCRAQLRRSDCHIKVDFAASWSLIKRERSLKMHQQPVFYYNKA